MPVKNIIPGQTVTKETFQRARELRREMTPAEKTGSVWQELRGNKLGEKTIHEFLPRINEWRSPIREFVFHSRTVIHPSSFQIHPCSYGRNYSGTSWESILAPSAFDTSPKYDKKKSECGFKIYIVVFGGGRVGALGLSWISTVTKLGWLLKWMEMSTIYKRMKMQGGTRLCVRWGYRLSAFGMKRL